MNVVFQMQTPLAFISSLNRAKARHAFGESIFAKKKGKGARG